MKEELYCHPRRELCRHTARGVGGIFFSVSIIDGRIYYRPDFLIIIMRPNSVFLKILRKESQNRN